MKQKLIIHHEYGIKLQVFHYAGDDIFDVAVKTLSPLHSVLTSTFTCFQLTASKADEKKSQDELAKVSKDLESTKTELKKMKDIKVKFDDAQKQLEALKKKSADVEAEVFRFM